EAAGAASRSPARQDGESEGERGLGFIHAASTRPRPHPPSQRDPPDQKADQETQGPPCADGNPIIAFTERAARPAIGTEPIAFRLSGEGRLAFAASWYCHDAFPFNGTG